MKLQRDIELGKNLVTAIGADYINVNGIRHEKSFLLLPKHIEPGWGAAGFDALRESDFTRIIESLSIRCSLPDRGHELGYCLYNAQKFIHHQVT